MVSQSKNDTAAVIWLSGGTVGKTYVIQNRIVTVAGRQEDESFGILVVEG